MCRFAKQDLVTRLASLMHEDSQEMKSLIEELQEQHAQFVEDRSAMESTIASQQVQLADMAGKRRQELEVHTGAKTALYTTAVLTAVLGYLLISLPAVLACSVITNCVHVCVSAE